MLIHRVTEALRKKKVEYAICGGWAVALHGAVRGTVDLDIALVLTPTNLKRAEEALKSIGLESRLPISAEEVAQFREEYVTNRKMVAWRFMNPQNQTEIVDLVINQDLARMKTQTIKIGGHSIALVAISDLIQMKRLAGRPQDLEDIKALERLKK